MIYFGKTEPSHKVQDGHLIVEIDKIETYIYFFNTDFSYSDVKLTAAVTNIGVNMNSVSLTCRKSELGWYEFNVGNDGYYQIFLYNAVDNRFTLLYNGGSTAINTGKATNEYMATCNGEELSLYINGVHTRTVTNSYLTNGKIGISGSSYQYVPVTLWFDWLDIAQP